MESHTNPIENPLNIPSLSRISGECSRPISCWSLRPRSSSLTSHTPSNASPSPRPGVPRWSWLGAATSCHDSKLYLHPKIGSVILQLWPESVVKEWFYKVLHVLQIHMGVGLKIWNSGNSRNYQTNNAVWLDTPNSTKRLGWHGFGIGEIKKMISCHLIMFH